MYAGYKAGHVPHINIKGYVLASAFVLDSVQNTKMQVLFAYHMTLIPKELYESLEENCKGDYVNIDPDNTKCVSDFQAYSEVSNRLIV
ncbi:hypothetical protein TSUD_09840 [Trifolium subterraneum]|nr:hypothetical protein TSUD_09840 [Trifolium subterraneum]